jgi:hypothetical protein
VAARRGRRDFLVCGFEFECTHGGGV